MLCVLDNILKQYHVLSGSGIVSVGIIQNN